MAGSASSQSSPTATEPEGAPHDSVTAPESPWPSPSLSAYQVLVGAPSSISPSQSWSTPSHSSSASGLTRRSESSQSPGTSVVPSGWSQITVTTSSSP